MRPPIEVDVILVVLHILAIPFLDQMFRTGVSLEEKTAQREEGERVALTE